MARTHLAQVTGAFPRNITITEDLREVKSIFFRAYLFIYFYKFTGRHKEVMKSLFKKLFKIKSSLKKEICISER